MDSFGMINRVRKLLKAFERFGQVWPGLDGFGYDRQGLH